MNAWDIKREAALPLWQARIRECRSSGTTVKEWCAENGIDRRTYYKWEAYCLTRATQSVQREKEDQGAGSSMIKVNPAMLASSESQSPAPISVSPAELVIRCGRVSIDINSGVSAARIAELVAALNSHV